MANSFSQMILLMNLLICSSLILADYCEDYCNDNPCAYVDENVVQCKPNEIWKPESSKCGCCGSCIIPIDGGHECTEWNIEEEPPKRQCQRQFTCSKGHCLIVYVKNPKNDE